MVSLCCFHCAAVDFLVDMKIWYRYSKVFLTSQWKKQLEDHLRSRHSFCDRCADFSFLFTTAGGAFARALFHLKACTNAQVALPGNEGFLTTSREFIETLDFDAQILLRLIAAKKSPKELQRQIASGSATGE